MPQVYCQTALWFIIDHNHGPQLLWDRGTHIWTGGDTITIMGLPLDPAGGLLSPRPLCYVLANHRDRLTPMSFAEFFGFRWFLPSLC